MKYCLDTDSAKLIYEISKSFFFSNPLPTLEQKLLFISLSWQFARHFSNKKSATNFLEYIRVDEVIRVSQDLLFNIRDLMVSSILSINYLFIYLFIYLFLSLTLVGSINIFT